MKGRWLVTLAAIESELSRQKRHKPAHRDPAAFCLLSAGVESMYRYTWFSVVLFGILQQHETQAGLRLATHLTQVLNLGITGPCLVVSLW